MTPMSVHWKPVPVVCGSKMVHMAVLKCRTGKRLAVVVRAAGALLTGKKLPDRKNRVKVTAVIIAWAARCCRTAVVKANARQLNDAAATRTVTTKAGIVATGMG